MSRNNENSLTIYCSYCGISLCVIVPDVFTKKTSYRNTVVAHCWKCKDKSFEQEFKNYIEILDSEESTVVDVGFDETESKNINIVKTKKKKKEKTKK